jgi:hypothetical protein
MRTARILQRAALVALALLLAAGLSAAQGPDHAIPRWTVDAGGGRLAGGDYVLTGTAGQPEAGVLMEGGDYGLAGGFWGGGSAAPVGAHTVYLPLVLRNAP